MSGGGAPAAPNPYKTADAQSQANIAAIRESAKINALDQTAPWGSTTFTRDANGIPIGQNISLSPGEQANYDATTGIRNALAGRAGTMLNDGISGDAVGDALYRRQRSFIEPEISEGYDRKRVELEERGIPIGSEIYNKEYGRLDRGRDQAYAQIADQATLASGAEEDRQLNQILASVTGIPSQQPGFNQQPAYQVAPPDITGLVTNNYNQQLQNYNTQRSSMMNGLFGLGAAALMSERSTKTDIVRVGYLDNGLPVYAYRYLAPVKGPMMLGLMADEVQEVYPEAIVPWAAGTRAVDYGKVAELMGAHA